MNSDLALTLLILPILETVSGEAVRLFNILDRYPLSVVNAGYLTKEYVEKRRKSTITGVVP